MGGRIEVESDVGTTFRVLLRRARIAAAVVGDPA
jgi:hypothetical protein